MSKQTPEVSHPTDNEVRMSFHRMCERIAMTFIRCTAAVLCTALTASAANPKASSAQAPAVQAPYQIIATNVAKN